MKIVIVECAVTVGGTTVVASQVESLMRAHGHDVLVITPLSAAQTAGVFDPAARLECLRQAVTYDDSRLLKEVFRDRGRSPFTRLRAWLRNRFSHAYNIGYIVRLAWRLRRFRADIVHINNGLEPPFAAALARVPSLMHLHGTFGTSMPRLQTMSLRRPDRLLAISTCVADSAQRAGLPRERISLIPNFLMPRSMPSRAEARERLGIPATRPVVAVIGRVVQWKGQLELVRAMAEVVKSVPQALLVIAGSHSDGETEYYDSVQATARELGLGDNVQFTGHLADPYLAYRAADVVAHSSIDPEPFGMVLIEAMYAGTPLVAANSGGPLDVISDGTDGFLADPKDARAYARPVVELLTRPETARRIAAAASRKFAATYTGDAVYPKLLAFYEKTRGRDAAQGM